jgi:predicted SAM-dependent methyltransferase
MSTLPKPEGSATDAAVQQPPIPIYLDARTTFAAHYLFGQGLEIGPLHLPLATPPQAKVSYVDRMSVADLRAEYPELEGWNLTEPDIVDDGEKLTKVAAESQDFIIANHFLEHTENPIGTVQTHLGKLKPGGILFYAVPDKRFTFDYRRPVTPLEHMVADYEQGPERSRREHYEEWTRLVIGEPSSAGAEAQAVSEESATAKARELEEAAYSIHMHVWTQAEFLALMLELRRRTEGAFDLEVAARQGIEFMVILRKAGPLPNPAVAPPPPPPAAPLPPSRWSGQTGFRLRVRRALRAAKRELLGNRS